MKIIYGEMVDEDPDNVRSGPGHIDGYVWDVGHLSLYYYISNNNLAIHERRDLYSSDRKATKEEVRKLIPLIFTSEIRVGIK